MASMRIRALGTMAVAALCLSIGSARAQGPAAAPTRLVPPPEVSAVVNGKPARLLAEGEDILLTTAEADRLGLDFRRTEPVSIGPVKLWRVQLASIVVGGRTRQDAPAGVVVNVAAYFDAGQRHGTQVDALSRETRIEVNGKTVKAYNFGLGGYLLPSAEADRIGVPYRTQGQRADVDSIAAWTVMVDIGLNGRVIGSMPVLVTEPRAYFRHVQQVMDKAARPKLRP